MEMHFRPRFLAVACAEPFISHNRNSASSHQLSCDRPHSKILNFLKFRKLRFLNQTTKVEHMMLLCPWWKCTSVLAFWLLRVPNHQSVTTETAHSSHQFSCARNSNFVTLNSQWRPKPLHEASILRGQRCSQRCLGSRRSTCSSGSHFLWAAATHTPSRDTRWPSSLWLQCVSSLFLVGAVSRLLLSTGVHHKLSKAFQRAT